MRLVIQRVKEASVSVDGKDISEIGQGVLILVGISKKTRPELIADMAKKCANLRMFEDDRGKLHYSLIDLNAEVLVVSQFTLCANFDKGRRPDFSHAAPPQDAEPYYLDFCQEMKLLGLRVRKGVFGADMEVKLLNDGPVTFIIDQDDL